MSRTEQTETGHGGAGERRLPQLREVVEAPKAYAALLKEKVVRRLAEPEHRRSAVGLLSLAGAVALAFIVGVVFILSLPLERDPAAARLEQATIVFSADGEQLARYYNENRTWVPLEEVSPVVREALIATEDRRFYDHWGVDFRRTFSAVFKTLGGDTQGGSTITMQLVRNAYPEIGDDPALQRKLKEWIMALHLERKFTKEEILEAYLNTVPFNYNAFGIETAARTYFNKPASRLDAPEAATLVGMLKGTTYYNPVQNPEASRARRNVVLEVMAGEGYITAAELERLREQPLGLEFTPVTAERNRAPYFAEHLRGWLTDWAKARDLNLYEDGLRVYTTIDMEMQEVAEEAVRSVVEELHAVEAVSWSSASMPFVSSNPEAYLAHRDRVEPFAYFWRSRPQLLDRFVRGSDRYRRLVGDGTAPEQALARLKGDEAFLDSLKTAMTRLQAGFVAIDPANGHVKAWVGGPDFTQNKYDHVAQSRRQPGSTFKPFVYAAAIQEGHSPNDYVVDRKINYVDPSTGKRWSPSNFGGETGKAVRIRDALAHSKNTVTAQLILDVGPERVVQVARSLGIESPLTPVPSLGLGTNEVTLLEMVGAYAALTNNGRYREPVFVTRIENADGEVIARFQPEVRQALEPEVAYTVLDMMRGVVQGGTAVRLRGQYGAQGDLAGKTGTTQHGADGWFMLLHPDLVVGSWVGFPSPSINFRSQFWGQGAHNALHVVGRFYREADLSRTARFDPPPAYAAPRGGRLLVASFNGSGGLELRAGRLDNRFSVDRLNEMERRSLESALDRNERLPRRQRRRTRRNRPPRGEEQGQEQGQDQEQEDQEEFSETERLNRREMRNSDVDEYLDALEGRGE